MHITDYGLWFYCIEYGIFFDKPEEFITHIMTSVDFESLCALAKANADDGTAGFLDLTCDISYNGRDIDTSLKMKYMPKTNRITIQSARAKKILDSECYTQIGNYFHITQVQKKPNVLGQALIMDYRPGSAYQISSPTDFGIR